MHVITVHGTLSLIVCR